MFLQFHPPPLPCGSSDRFHWRIPTYICYNPSPCQVSEGVLPKIACHVSQVLTDVTFSYLHRDQHTFNDWRSFWSTLLQNLTLGIKLIACRSSLILPLLSIPLSTRLLQWSISPNHPVHNFSPSPPLIYFHGVTTSYNFLPHLHRMHYNLLQCIGQIWNHQFPFHICPLSFQIQGPSLQITSMSISTGKLTSSNLIVPSTEMYIFNSKCFSSSKYSVLHHSQPHLPYFYVHH